MMTIEEINALVNIFTEIQKQIIQSVNDDLRESELSDYESSLIRASLILGMQGGLALLTETDASSREFFDRIVRGEEMALDRRDYSKVLP